MVCAYRETSGAVTNRPAIAFTTRNIKGGSPSNSGPPSFSLQMPHASSSQSYLNSQTSSLAPNPAIWAESPNDSESLPPRMRLKEKSKPFGEFRIIREPAPIQDHTRDLKPIPSPPWANDSFSLDPSSRRLHDDTRGKAPSHARTSFPPNTATGPPGFRYQERCTHSRNNSKSSAECSTAGGLQALSISSGYAWTASSRSPPPPSSLSSTSKSTDSYPTSPSHQTDDASSDAEPSLGIAYQLRPHRTFKPHTRSAQTASTAHAAEERAQSVPDEDEGEMAMATAVLKQLQQSRMDANTFTPPARPSRKQKRYACDVCNQIFTRSGDVRRHKESRHEYSEGCRCPFCDRVLTRQDALQRHWDKYCRKKSKRHLDRQAAESQNRTIPSMAVPMCASGVPVQTTSTATTMGFGTGLDQTQINYRYLNIFG